MPHLLLSGGVGSSGWTLADDQTLTTSAGNMVCLVKLFNTTEISLLPNPASTTAFELVTEYV